MTTFRHVFSAVKSVVQDESGVTSIEYALLASLIAIAAMVGIVALGNGVQGLWTTVSDAVAAVM